MTTEDRESVLQMIIGTATMAAIAFIHDALDNTIDQWPFELGEIEPFKELLSGIVDSLSALEDDMMNAMSKLRDRTFGVVESTEISEPLPGISR